MSHAGLVKLYIEGKYPDNMDNYKPMNKEEIEEKKIREKEFKKEFKEKSERKEKGTNQQFVRRNQIIKKYNDNE